MFATVGTIIITEYIMYFVRTVHKTYGTGTNTSRKFTVTMDTVTLDTTVVAITTNDVSS